MAGSQKQHCQFGKHYFKPKDTKTSARTRLQGTRKIGCLAHIHIHSITLYPSFALSNAASLGARQLKRRRAEQLSKLKTALASDAALQTQSKFYVLLPKPEAHHVHHDTSGAVALAQRIHPNLVDKIKELVTEGVTDTSEVKRSLKNYVIHVLCPQEKPNETNRTYFPTNDDIRNHIYRAKKSLELSKFDQDNLILKIKQWQMQKPRSKFYFQPHKEVKAEDVDKHVPELDPQMNNATIQTLLYIHQEEWQQELLQKYGNTIALIDATYRTTKYEIPLFFISVKTNVGYTIVADFIVQNETIQQITEALQIISLWNPEWKPCFFMTDYCEAEMSAIVNVFPSCKVFLCDFHREQAWGRWVKDRKHGLSPSDGELLLGLLRDCAWAPTPEDSTHPPDHYYQQAVERLKKTQLWITNAQLRDWMESTWFSIPEVYTNSMKTCLHVHHMFQAV